MLGNIEVQVVKSSFQDSKPKAQSPKPQMLKAYLEKSLSSAIVNGASTIEEILYLLAFVLRLSKLESGFLGPIVTGLDLCDCRTLVQAAAASETAAA